MKGMWRYLCVLFAGFALPGIALAQSTAELHVAVKDPKGAVVRAATVTVRNEARNLERTVKDNVDGEYQFLLLPPGQYKVVVDAAGFAKTTLNNVTVTVGQKA
jgi:hypothetical protein